MKGNDAAVTKEAFFKFGQTRAGFVPATMTSNSFPGIQTDVFLAKLELSGTESRNFVRQVLL